MNYLFSKTPLKMCGSRPLGSAVPHDEYPSSEATWMLPRDSMTKRRGEARSLAGIRDKLLTCRPQTPEKKKRTCSIQEKGNGTVRQDEDLFDQLIRAYRIEPDSEIILSEGCLIPPTLLGVTCLSLTLRAVPGGPRMSLQGPKSDRGRWPVKRANRRRDERGQVEELKRNTASMPIIQAYLQA